MMLQQLNITSDDTPKVITFPENIPQENVYVYVNNILVTDYKLSLIDDDDDAFTTVLVFEYDDIISGNIQDKLPEIPIDESDKSINDELLIEHDNETKTIKVKPPLQQIKDGVIPQDVQCNDGLILTMLHNNKVACLKEHTLIMF